MAKLIGVQFQKNGKLYYFDANGLDPKPGDYVIVDSARGNDLGMVTMGLREIDEKTWHSPLKKTIRIATEQDIQHGVENRKKEKEAFSICQKKIAEHKLEMKLVSVEYAFDNTKILFFFTANGRVDFRSLVKDLASIFKMRIELRQIGVRDEAKMLGGLGPCGRPICCGAFLDQFQPVSIKMAKEQNLSLNPTKISGVCGRLMCCLKYEQEHYEMTRKKMPRIGKEVTTPDGAGQVTDLNIVKETVFVRLTNGDTSEIKEYPLESIIRPAESQQNTELIQTFTKKVTEQTLNEVKQKKSTAGKDNRTEKGKKAERPENVKEGDSFTGKGRTSYGSRKMTLGQPVRRENPNRKDTSPKNTEPVKSDDSAPKQVESIDESQNNPWTDALQKAIQAINPDN